MTGKTNTVKAYIFAIDIVLNFDSNVVSTSLEPSKPVAEGGGPGGGSAPQQEIKLKLCPTKLKFALAYFNHIYRSYK